MAPPGIIAAMTANASVWALA